DSPRCGTWSDCARRRGGNPPVYQLCGGRTQARAPHAPRRSTRDYLTGLPLLRRLGGLLGHLQPRFPGIGSGDGRTVGPELKDLVLAGIVTRPFRQPHTIRVARLSEVGPVSVERPG